MDKGSGQVGDKTRRWAALALTCVVAALCAGVASGTASASSTKVAAPTQTCPSYPNCPPPGGGTPTLKIETNKVVYAPNEDVLVKVSGFTPVSGDVGDVSYRGEHKFDTVERGDGIGGPASGNAAGTASLELAAAAAPQPIAAVVQTADFPSGSFKAQPAGSNGPVCVTSPGYNTACTGISITGVESSRGGGGGGLAFTGFELALFLALALILLVVGANLVQWSRRRRRRMAREREAAHAQAHRERHLTNR